MTRSSLFKQIALILASVFPFVGCEEVEEPAVPRLTPTEDFKEVTSGGNEFAMDLYGQLSEREGNLFFSPFSVSTALGMTYAGARGETEAEMAKVFHFTLPQDRLHAANGALIQDLNGAEKNRGYALNIANRLWGRVGDKFLDDFLEINRRDYDAEFQQMDFVSDPEGSRKTINDWVEDQTNDKIKELLKPRHIDANTVLVLTNAIYFKGDWAKQFKESATQDASFYVDADTEVTVPTMVQSDEFLLGQNKTLQILEMPYEGDDLVMTILLPTKRHGLAEIESQLSMEKLEEWRGLMHQGEVDVWLPKFKMTFEVELNEVLENLGMSSAFNGSADFSGMADRGGLYISAVVHKAFVEVNEEGTEAAAATAVVVTESAAIANEFRADHPFVFMIRDNHTGSILFMGRVTNPVDE